MVGSCFGKALSLSVLGTLTNGAGESVLAISSSASVGNLSEKISRTVLRAECMWNNKVFED